VGCAECLLVSLLSEAVVCVCVCVRERESVCVCVERSAKLYM